jgi:hypothetical protein
MKTLSFPVSCDLTSSSIQYGISVFSNEFPDKRMFYVVGMPIASIQQAMEYRAYFDKAKPAVLIIQKEDLRGFQWDIVAYDLITYEPLAQIHSEGAP